MAVDVWGALKRGIHEHIFNRVGALTCAPRVQLSSPLIRGGNFLYYWQWAFCQDRPGRPARVLYQESINAWLEEFPLAARLTVRKADVPVWRTEWVGKHRHTFGLDFTRSQLQVFSDALIGESQRFQSRLDAAGRFLDDETCVINVRRGDYYEYPHLEKMYGLDNVRYVDEAVAQVRSLRPEIRRFVLVSDDIDWCRDHLSNAVIRTLEVYPMRTSMFDDLAILSSARTLLVANSTFSFWGSYIAASRIKDQLTIAPPYHYRLESGELVRDPFDPDWLIVGGIEDRM